MNSKVVDISKIVQSIDLIHNTNDVESLYSRIENTESSFIVSFVNAHALNLAYNNKAFAEALLSSNIILRDGIGMKILYRYLGVNEGLNMNGTDFIPDLLDKFKGERTVLIGTEEPFISKSADILNNNGHFVVGYINGFLNSEDYVKFINKHKPRIVVLAMGMPKQELVAIELKNKADYPCIIINGGAILDFIGGKVKRAPKWLRVIGFEWLYRLLNEPLRLFNRYVVGNFIFIKRFKRIKKYLQLANRNEEFIRINNYVKRSL